MLLEIGQKIRVKHRNNFMTAEVKYFKGDANPIVAIQEDAAIKTNYTNKDIEEMREFDNAAVVGDGQLVQIVNHGRHRVKVMGNYADCVEFIFIDNA